MADNDKAQRQALRGQLALAGFTLPFDISPFIEQTIRAGQGMDYLYSIIIRSKRFRKFYPGIFRPNGTLKMTPGEYEAYVDAAKAGAGASGFRITRKQIGRAIALNKSADEFAFVVKAAAQVRANRDVFNALNAQLRAAGLAPIKSAQQAFNFLNRRSAKNVYDVYEAASIGAAAREAGVDLTTSLARGLAKKTAGVISLEDAQKNFAQLAADRTLADVELAAEGLSTRDQALIAIGAADATVIERYKRALRQRQAQLEEPISAERVGLDPITGRPVTRRPPEEPGL